MKNKYRGALKLMSRIMEVTGYSERTVWRIVAKKTELDGAAFTSPPKRYRRERKRIDPDHFDTEALQCTVHEFYFEKKYPTLDMLLVAVREKVIFSGERTALWKFLHKMGFKHKKVNDKQYIYEQARITVQRHEYLRRLRRNRCEHRPVAYLDETWANPHDGVEKMWVKDDPKAVGGTKCGIRKPSGKGSRLIILHAGSENGWVSDAAVVFQSKKSTSDFDEWFLDLLLPNINIV